MTNWTYTGVPGGIPHRTTICATFNPGATAAAITSALDSCSSGGVVYLNAGVYTSATLGGTIKIYNSNVTLRGAGAEKTTLQGQNILALGNGYVVTGPNVTAGGAQGTNTITVSSTSSLSVGQMIEVDRNDDPNLVVNMSGPSVVARSISQVNVVTTIAGNAVTVRNPWFYDFSTATPKVKWLYQMRTFKSGVENLKLDHSGSIAGSDSPINYCDSCWVKAVESGHSWGYHFIALGTVNFEFRDSFVHDAINAGPNNSGVNFYGNTLYGGNSNGKVENNIFNNSFPAIEINGSSSGLYIGYNFVNGSGDFGGGLFLVTWTFDDGHAPFNIMNLFEGNIGEMWGMDGYYGGSGLGTIHRNYITGYNPNGRVAGDAIQIKRLGYFYNFVGNVLGSTKQAPTSYETGCGTNSIYQLGYPNIGNCDTVPWDGFNVTGGYPDMKVSSTLLRWGNYDYFHHASRFDATEIPTGVTVPGNNLIPNSYAYTAKPAWWPTSVAWPPIGPDVTGGSGDASGHVNKTPAQLCWEASSLLSGGAFSAAVCYPNSL
jgi:hypothetical protein